MKPNYSDAGLWWKWVIATGAGLGLGLATWPLAMSGAGGIGLIGPLVGFPGLISAIAMGLVGLFQGLVLRPHLRRANWWFAATLVGWGVFFGLSYSGAFFFPYVRLGFGFITPFVNGDIYSGAEVGLVVGFFQWLVLRQTVKEASWWIAISTLGFGLSLPLAAGIGIYRTTLSSNIGYAANPYITLGESAAVGGILIGAVTGFGLIWLLHQRKDQDNVQAAPEPSDNPS
ncbi:MAG: hypothetical protein ABI947_23395 [Chloroflexota bacterium]